MSLTKQFLFGTKNCNCNLGRKDGLHNFNCASWKNGWFPKRLQRKRVNDLATTDPEANPDVSNPQLRPKERKF